MKIIIEYSKPDKRKFFKKRTSTLISKEFDSLENGLKKAITYCHNINSNIYDIYFVYGSMEVRQVSFIDLLNYYTWTIKFIVSEEIKEKNYKK